MKVPPPGWADALHARANGLQLAHPLQMDADGFVRLAPQAPPLFTGAEGDLPRTGSEQTCEVNGKPVQELSVLIKPVASFVTRGDGVHELDKVYFHGGEVYFGANLKRLGGMRPISVRLVTNDGLWLEMERGYTVHIPEGMLQATWRV